MLCHCIKLLRTGQDLLGKQNLSSAITDTAQCNDFHNLIEDSIINNQGLSLGFFKSPVLGTGKLFYIANIQSSNN